MENLYEFVFDADLMDGVYGISLVKSPAIEIEMVHFSEEKPQEWKMTNEEKHIVTSPVLIPNQKIYRKDIQGNGSGYVFASEETISALQQNFFKQGFNFNSTIEHSGQLLKDVYFFESWIVEDASNDKSNALGFNVPKGSWVISMKIDNKDIWDNYIKTGEVLGLSIDGMLSTKKINNNNNNNNNNYKIETMNSQIQKIVENAIEQIKLAAGLAIGDTFVDADGNPVLSAETELDGKIYSTDENGIITEIADAISDNTEDMAPEAPVAQAIDPALETPAETVGELPTEETPVEDDKDKIIADLMAKVSELEAKCAEMEAEMVIKENEVIAMANEKPASSGISNLPIETVKAFKDMTPREKFIAQHSKI